MDCSVRVVVRFRPVNEREKTEDTRSARGAGTAFVVREDQRSVEVARPDGQFLVQRGSPDVFSFDRVFGGEAHQADVYSVVAEETIVDVLNGYNGTIFAYGQTGSGKSFTMFGRDIETDERGIIPRACSQLFKHITEDKEGTEFTIKCSFMEIYKERVRDLLNPKSVNLKIHETPTRGVWVEDITEEFVATEDDVLELLRLGDKFRAVTPTRMNDASSRSHSLFVLTLHQRMPDGSTKTGRLNLADLAGSEKVAKTGAKGNTLEEAKNINKSLAALGNCINALTTKGKSHVPYRDSKLTHILKESLGGNSKTTLVCTCSPHEFNAEETISTLRFGQRAKTIKNSVQVNKQRSVEELNEIIAMLRKEVKALKRYAIFLESEMRKLKGSDWAPPSVIPRAVPASPASSARSVSGSGPAASPYKPSTPSSARSLGGAGTPSRASLMMGSNRRDSDDLGDGGMSDMLDPVRVAEMRVEMKKLLMASSVQIEQLQDDLKGVQEEEYQNKEKISRLKQELNERESEKERLVREVENKDMELGSQVRRLHYELKQALLDVENATAQLKDAGSANEELQEELTLSKEEVERLISDRESLVEELAKILQPEQAQLINLEELRKNPAGREAKRAEAKAQAEKREAEEWRKKEDLYVKKSAAAALRIEEMEREMEELRQKARQTEQALDEEKRRAAQRERELKRQVELMSEAEDIARRRGAAATMKVVKPIRASIKEQLFQRKSLKRRELAGVVLKEGWLTKEGGLVRNWKKRWFVLQDGNLYYYENANKVTGKGCVLLEGCVVTPAEGETKKKHSFAIYHDSRRTFYLQAADAKELSEWTEALAEAIDHTDRETSFTASDKSD